VDHFSRSVVAKRAFRKEPSAADVCALLDRAVRNAGRAPRHLVSDQGPQFGDEYRAWCARHGAKPRFGKIGEHGSIAIVERFWRSMKQECFRRLSVVPFALPAFEADSMPASERLALEPRARYPLARGDPKRRRRRRLRGRLELFVTHFRKRAHLPIVELRPAA
jgi:transposase InsO family protein